MLMTGSTLSHQIYQIPVNSRPRSGPNPWNPLIQSKTMSEKCVVAPFYNYIFNAANAVYFHVHGYICICQG